MNSIKKAATVIVKDEQQLLRKEKVLDSQEKIINTMETKISSDEQAVTRKTQNINEVIVGQTVTHKTFGQGQVKVIVDGRIIVAFGNSEKMFMYPDAFKMGYLAKI